VVEEDAAGRGELDATAAADEKRCADLVFEVANLPAERGLSRIELLFGGKSEASSFGNGHEVAEMSEFQRGLCLKSITPQPTKQCSREWIDAMLSEANWIGDSERWLVEWKVK
jgi:hypothetical protein